MFTIKIGNKMKSIENSKSIKSFRWLYYTYEAIRSGDKQLINKLMEGAFIPECIERGIENEEWLLLAEKVIKTLPPGEERIKAEMKVAKVYLLKGKFNSALRIIKRWKKEKENFNYFKELAKYCVSKGKPEYAQKIVELLPKEELSKLQKEISNEGGKNE
jgi:hypothetical protein